MVAGVVLHEVLAELNHHDLELRLAFLQGLLALLPFLSQNTLFFFNFSAEIFEGSSLLFQHDLALAIVRVEFAIQLLNLLS